VDGEGNAQPWPRQDKYDKYQGRGWQEKPYYDHKGNDHQWKDDDKQWPDKKWDKEGGGSSYEAWKGK